MNIQLGRKLIFDGRVPFVTKLLAGGIGFAVFGIVTLFELPVEGVLAAILPVIGIVGDAALEGVEGVAIPLMVVWLLLPYMAPREIVEAVRRELTPTPPEKPVYECDAEVIDKR